MFIHKKTVIFIPYFDSPFCLINYWQNGGFFLKSEIPAIDSEGDAERAVLQVKKAVDEERQKAVHCSGTCIGIPQIVPGRSLTIRKLDAWIDGTYEILSVEHRIDENGYTTQFELGG